GGRTRATTIRVPLAPFYQASTAPEIGRSGKQRLHPLALTVIERPAERIRSAGPCTLFRPERHRDGVRNVCASWHASGYRRPANDERAHHTIARDHFVDHGLAEMLQAVAPHRQYLDRINNASVERQINFRRRRRSR